MDISNPQTYNLNCPTCLMGFAGEAEHKSHYKSDFHRYNLKRKMVKLAPISFDQFQNKRTLASAQETTEYKCNQCSKRFQNIKTLRQHAQSKKHNPNMVITNPEQKPTPKLPPKFEKNARKCLFSGLVSETIEQNLYHMKKMYGFFVPQAEYCKNVKGLLEYLQEKIEVGLMCIFCDDKKQFITADAVRQHMIDKGHTFMNTKDGYEEYEDFYDFSSQFDAVLSDQKDKIVPGIKYETVKVYVDDKEKQENDEEWESAEDSNEEEQWESDDEEGSNIEEQEEQIEEKKSKTETKKTKKVKAFKIMKPTLTNHDQLLLPNGKLLGHRKYRHLYKQTFYTPFWLREQYKAICDQNTRNSLIEKKNLIQLIKKEKLFKKQKKRSDKKHLKVGMQNNILMKFFRTSNSL